MKNFATWLFLTTLLCSCATATTAEPIRINGSSEASFDASFNSLVRSLNARERRALALGLFGTLVSHECLAPQAVIHLTFSPVGPKDAPLVRPCREHLNGMSYQDILAAVEPQAGTSTPEVPNNSFNPMPLRGTG